MVLLQKYRVLFVMIGIRKLKMTKYKQMVVLVRVRQFQYVLLVAKLLKHLEHLVTITM